MQTFIETGNGSPIPVFDEVRVGRVVLLWLLLLLFRTATAGQFDVGLVRNGAEIAVRRSPSRAFL